MNQAKKIKQILLIAALLLSSMPAVSFAEEENSDIKLQYKIGDGLYIGNDDSSIHIQGRVQARFTHTLLDNAADTSTFSIPRGELKLDGYTLRKKLKFAFQMKLATKERATTKAVCANAACTSTVNAITAESTSGVATLSDYYIDWVPSALIGIKFGQFKVPFLLQQLTSSTKQQFIDRSLATGFFDFSRDIGINVHGSVLNKKLNYSVFAMNGDGANSFNRNNRALLAGVRLEVPILGEYKYSEGDVEHSENIHFGLGGAYAFNEGSKALQSGTIAAFNKAHHGTIDTIFKYKGFSLHGAGMVTRSAEGPQRTNWGFNGQAGYFIIPKKFELVAKAGAGFFDGAAVNQFEYAGGLNYYFRGHGIKLQADYSFLKNDGGVSGVNNHRIRAAMNLIF